MARLLYPCVDDRGACRHRGLAFPPCGERGPQPSRMGLSIDLAPQIRVETD